MALSWLNTITPIVSLLSGLAGERKVAKAKASAYAQTPAEKSSAALLAALGNPNSPLLQQLTEQERQQNVADYLSSIRGMQQSDRRQVALGRRPTFFNPERADEALSFLTSRGIPKLNQASKENAIRRIAAAAGGYSGLINAQGQRQAGMATLKGSMAERQSELPTQLLSMIGGMSYSPQDAFSILGNPNVKQYNPISWY